MSDAVLNNLRDLIQVDVGGRGLRTDPAFNLKSVVTFTLTRTADGTRLRVEQSGFRPEQRQAFGGAQAGWRQFLGKLEEVLARTE